MPNRSFRLCNVNVFICVWQPCDAECFQGKEYFQLRAAATEVIVLSHRGCYTHLLYLFHCHSLGPSEHGFPKASSCQFNLQNLSFLFLFWVFWGLFVAAVIVVLWQGPIGTANRYYLWLCSDLQSGSRVWYSLLCQHLCISQSFQERKALSPWPSAVLQELLWMVSLTPWIYIK